MKRLRETREARGLSQTKLSELSGVRAATISEIESGKVVPNLKTAFKLADALGTTVDKLRGDKNLDEPPARAVGE